MSRDDLTNILKGYGAKVTGSVSKKTTYLVAGEYLEDGRPKNQGNKYRKAEEIGTKIISYEELQEIIREKYSSDFRNRICSAFYRSYNNWNYRK